MINALANAVAALRLNLFRCTLIHNITQLVSLVKRACNVAAAVFVDMCVFPAVYSNVKVDAAVFILVLLHSEVTKCLCCTLELVSVANSLMLSCYVIVQWAYVNPRWLSVCAYRVYICLRVKAVLYVACFSKVQGLKSFIKHYYTHAARPV